MLAALLGWNELYLPQRSGESLTAGKRPQSVAADAVAHAAGDHHDRPAPQ
jgi:hypothetical protein